MLKQEKLNIIVDQTLENDDYKNYKFKSLQTAFDAIPIGGAADITIKNHYKIEDIINTGSNKTINLYINDDSKLETEWVKITEGNFKNFIKCNYIYIEENSTLNIILNDNTSIWPDNSTNDNESETTLQTEEKILIPDFTDEYIDLMPFAKGMFAYDSSKAPITFTINSNVKNINAITQYLGYLLFNVNTKSQAGNNLSLIFENNERNYYMIDPYKAKIADISNSVFNFNVENVSKIVNFNETAFENLYGNISFLFKGLIFDKDQKCININSNYILSFIDSKIIKQQIITCGNPTVTAKINKNAVIIDEDFYNSNEKPFSLYHDLKGAKPKYYRNCVLVINNFSTPEINLDFKDSCIQINNIPTIKSYSSLLAIDAHYYGEINNVKFIFKPKNDDRNIFIRTCISNVVNAYGSPTRNLVFNNCTFEIYMDYQYLFYLNGSNLIFNNCTFKLIKDTVNVYRNRGNFKLNDCKIELI